MKLGDGLRKESKRKNLSLDEVASRWGLSVDGVSL
jgi:hypothetical protein